jgi:hypothetical protein
MISCNLRWLKAVIFCFFEIWCVILFASDVFDSCRHLRQIIIQLFLPKATILRIVCNNQVSWGRSPSDFAWSRSSWSTRHSRWSSAFAWSTYWLVSVNIIYLSPVYTFVNNVGLSNRLKRLCPLSWCAILFVWSLVWDAIRSDRVLWVIVSAELLLVYLSSN